MMQYRKATAGDIPVLVDLRKKQLLDEGIEPVRRIDAALTGFFRKRLSDGSLIQWVAEDHGAIVATGAVIFYEFPPTYTNESGKKAHFANMYTAPDYRGRGIATNMLNRLAAETKAAGITKVWMGASKMGRPVYEKFGFRDIITWMEMDL